MLARRFAAATALALTGLTAACRDDYYYERPARYGYYNGGYRQPYWGWYGDYYYPGTGCTSMTAIARRAAGTMASSAIGSIASGGGGAVSSVTNGAASGMCRAAIGGSVTSRERRPGRA